MKCREYEQSIYLWGEISLEEQVVVKKHLETCADCAALFQQVQLMQQQVSEVSKNKTTAPHVAQLTSRIMQAVHEQQRNSGVNLTTRLFSPFQLTRYALAMLTLILIVSFGLEYTHTGIQQKQTITLEEGVILTSAMIRSSSADRKKRKSIFNTCKTPFSDQLAYQECLKQQFQ